MGTEIKVWQVNQDKLEPLDEAAYSTETTEEQLENWIESCPNLLGEELLVLTRQHTIPDVGRLDLLCLNEESQVVVVELKRELAPREAVAQALDYAAWLDGVTENDIMQLAANSSSSNGKTLSEAFEEKFGADLQSINPKNHRILVVGTRFDSAAERIINYLAQRHNVNINAVFFKYAKLPNGQRLLLRSVLMPDHITETRQGTMTQQQLQNMVNQRNNRALVDACLTLVQQDYVWPEYATTYGGSYRLWGKHDKDSKPKMVLGLNIAHEQWDTPPTQLDVWIGLKQASEISELSIKELEEQLNTCNVIAKRPSKWFFRLRTPQDSEKLIAIIKNFWDRRKTKVPATRP